MLSVDIDADPATTSRVTALIEDLAALAAELVITKARYTDVSTWLAAAAHVARGRAPALDPASRHPGDAVGLAGAGMLLPAYEVAGDSFDYSLNDDTLEVAVSTRSATTSSRR